MFDGFYIYTYYQTRDGNQPYITCFERVDGQQLNIHGDQNFAPVEFAGAATTVLFYVSVSGYHNNSFVAL